MINFWSGALAKRHISPTLEGLMGRWQGDHLFEQLESP